MATSNYNLPTISDNMANDVVKDMNALAEATDAALKTAIDGIDLTEIDQKVNTVSSDLTQHLTESATLSTKGHVQLSSDTNSTAETLAATPKAVKTLNDSKAAKGQGAWLSTSFLAGWTGTVLYRKNDVNIVSIAFDGYGGSVAALTEIAIIPDGYRPRYAAGVNLYKATNGTFVGSVYVSLSGRITIPTGVSLPAGESLTGTVSYSLT